MARDAAEVYTWVPVSGNKFKGKCLMWRINSKGLTLQEVLIMAYMNVLEAAS